MRLLCLSLKSGWLFVILFTPYIWIPFNFQITLLLVWRWINTYSALVARLRIVRHAWKPPYKLEIFSAIFSIVLCLNLKTYRIFGGMIVHLKSSSLGVYPKRMQLNVTKCRIYCTSAHRRDDILNLLINCIVFQIYSLYKLFRISSYRRINCCTFP